MMVRHNLTLIDPKPDEKDNEINPGSAVMVISGQTYFHNELLV